MIIYPSRSQSAPVVDVSTCTNRVQESRLFAALLESGWGLKVNDTQFKSIFNINQFFPISYAQKTPDKIHTISISIDHSKPTTVFGNVIRPLIFPEWISRCSASTPNRRLLCSFEGYAKPERVVSALDILKISFANVSACTNAICEIYARNPNLPFRNEVLNRLFKRINRDQPCEFTWTNNGRNVDNKVYDRDYWDTLFSSQTIYCPAGDFGWTYRFYESMLAKALPVIHKADQGGHTLEFFTLNKIVSINSIPNYNQIVENNFSKAKALICAKDALSPVNFL